ncbi:MAG: MBL fold metallo-hydrolase [Prevotella sp.]|nr:MBL fold metallo-hydrolase [Prevotella sp.]
MLKFISFGSGSSGNCYYLFTATDGLLIDTGIGIRTLKKYFKDYGLSLSSVHNVLITHDHADHVKSVGCLSGDYNLPVYTTPEVHQGIGRNYCVQRKINQEHIRYVAKGETLTLGDFRITPFGVPHDSADNVGYCIECEGVTFCLITDAGSITDEMKTFIGKAHYLVIEANHDEEMLKNGPYPQHLKRRILSGNGHLSNTACGTALVENMTERLHGVWLCHLSEDNNHPELARKTVETILSSHGVIAGTDIKLEVLKRKVPSGIYELTL